MKFDSASPIFGLKFQSLQELHLGMFIYYDKMTEMTESLFTLQVRAAHHIPFMHITFDGRRVYIELLYPGLSLS